MRHDLGMDLNPPTAHLVPIRSISSQSIDTLSPCLRYLRTLYNPPVRGTRRVTKRYHQDDEKLHALRSDSFERSYAIRWLTALISQRSADETLASEAASLLAACAGTASAGVVSRVFEFARSPDNSNGGGGVVTLHIRDTPLENQDYGTLGKQTWGGACVLSEMMAECPERFFPLSTKKEGRRVRILELGAGTGLAGLTACKILDAYPEMKYTLVTTDFNNAVLENLAFNVETNYPTHPNPNPCSGNTIVVHRLDWSAYADLETSPKPPFDMPFDVIIGADIIYEAEHAVWIKKCLENLLRRRDDGEVDYEPIFHLLIPLRRTHSAESGTIPLVFVAANDGIENLVILESETIVCSGETDREEHLVEYVYYRIGRQ